MKIIIVGSGPQAFFMLNIYKQIADVIELVYLNTKVATFSNVPNKKSFFSDKKQLSDYLLAAINSGYCIYFAGGMEIQSVLETSPEIFDCEKVQPNKLKALVTFISKEKTYIQAKNIGINTLPSLKLTKFLCSELVFDGPYFLKWDEENVNPQFSHFKTQMLVTKEDVVSFVDIFDNEAINKLIIQKYIRLSKGSNISYLGYYNQGSHVFGMLGQQLLQFPVGITAYLTEYHGHKKSELTNVAIRLIESVGLTGFCEVEFIVDSLTNEYYLLEVNPRPCGWASALLGKFENVAAMIADNTTMPINKNNSVEWINILRYLKATLQKGIICFVIALFKIPFIKCYDVFSILDLKPFLSQFRAKK